MIIRSKTARNIEQFQEAAIFNVEEAKIEDFLDITNQNDELNVNEETEDNQLDADEVIGINTERHFETHMKQCFFSSK